MPSPPTSRPSSSRATPSVTVGSSSAKPPADGPNSPGEKSHLKRLELGRRLHQLSAMPTSMVGSQERRRILNELERRRQLQASNGLKNLQQVYGATQLPPLARQAAAQPGKQPGGFMRGIELTKEVLGEGASAVVRLARLGPRRLEVAAKIADKSKLGAEELQWVRDEIRVHKGRAADGARPARSWRGSGGGAPPAVWSREMRWRTEVAKMTRAWESSTKVDEGEVEKQEVGRASALISEEARCGPNIGERALAWHGSRGGVVRRCPPRECVCARAYKPVNTQ